MHLFKMTDKLMNLRGVKRSCQATNKHNNRYEK